jgi:hypothetical protein
MAISRIDIPIAHLPLRIMTARPRATDFVLQTWRY